MEMRRMMPDRVRAFSPLSSISLTAAILSRAVELAASLAMSVRIVTASTLFHPFSSRAFPTLAGSNIPIRVANGPWPSGSDLRMAVSLAISLVYVQPRCPDSWPHGASSSSIL